MALEPSPDTGFELTSDPPGGLVWLDEAPVKEASGQQARTNFRASRISPGHHVLEIRGENRFKPWRQDVEIEPGAIRKIHALLIPAVGGPAWHRQARAAGHLAAPGARPRNTGRDIAAAGCAADTGAGRAQAARPAHHPAAGYGHYHPSRGPPPPGPVAVKKRKVKEPPPEEIEEDKETPAPRRAAVAADESGGDCSITVNSIPWSEVWIDGKNTTKHTPIVDFKLPCGKHKLAFKRSDMQIDQTESINVRPGQNFKQRYTLATED